MIVLGRQSSPLLQPCKEKSQRSALLQVALSGPTCPRQDTFSMPSTTALSCHSVPAGVIDELAPIRQSRQQCGAQPPPALAPRAHPKNLLLTKKLLLLLLLLLLAAPAAHLQVLVA